ncbi:MAG: MFS transporter [Alphaproteobacteria bacterium]|nr:MFS transporter [Alphaproteobacteria bacterium]
MKKQSSLRRFLFNVYGYSFFNCLIFMNPVYLLFFAESGVSDVGLSVLLIIWSLFVVVTQIPVLMSANKFSRKAVMLVTQFMKMSCFIVWVIWPTFWGFALGFLLWGIMWAAYNVVWEAIVFDELQARRHKAIYTKVCGRKGAIENIAYIIAGTGSLMIPLGYEVIAVATAISMILAMVFMFRMDIKTQNVVKRSANVVKSLRTAGTVLRRAPYILYLMILCNLLYGFSQIDEYLGLIGVEMGIRPELVGGLFILSLVFQAFGNTFADKFDKMPDRKLFAGVSYIGLIMIIMASIFSVPGLVFFALFYFCYSIVRVLVYSRFQHAIPSASRGAFLSMYSFCEQGTVILSYAVFILGVSMGGGYRLGIFLSGVASVMVGIWAMTYIPKKKKLYDRLMRYRQGAAAIMK